MSFCEPVTCCCSPRILGGSSTVNNGVKTARRSCERFNYNTFRSSYPRFSLCTRRGERAIENNTIITHCVITRKGFITSKGLFTLRKWAGRCVYIFGLFSDCYGLGGLGCILCLCRFLRGGLQRNDARYGNLPAFGSLQA